MNVQLLIDSIVRQTTVLVAQLATSGGLRAPLAHVANRVFLDLATELERQNVSRKVSADMFGLALRGYQRRIRRLTESSTERGRSLWEAVLDYVGSGSVRTRAQIMGRFSGDEEALVRGVLRDLSDSGLVFCSGTGPGAVYRGTTAEEMNEVRDALGREGFDEFVWLTVFRNRPIPRARLGQLVGGKADELDAALARLVADGRLSEQIEGEQRVFTSGEFVIALGESVGWTAAVLDHFQAVVTTICSKLRTGTSDADDRTGGSTYTFTIWSGHPFEDDVGGELSRYRERQTALRAKVDEYNRKHGIPTDHVEVISYAGQSVVAREHDEDREAADDDDD